MAACLARKPAPTFTADAVVDGDFKKVSLSDLTKDGQCSCRLERSACDVARRQLLLESSLTVLVLPRCVIPMKCRRCFGFLPS